MRHHRLILALVALTLISPSCGSGDGASGDAGDPERGAEFYEATCSECHGPQGTGSDSGPPLVDDIYRPNHHADSAFLLAVRRGVPQHHWRFGVMPPQEGLSDADVADITAYIRDLQRQAGIG